MLEIVTQCKKTNKQTKNKEKTHTCSKETRKTLKQLYKKCKKKKQT